MPLLHIISRVPTEQFGQALGHTTIYMTDRYNQVEDELTETTTDLFLNHIR
ncbi:hypothetical protein [Streptococcus mitis]|uniref:hypothetical protein n=1 Tax=Streptococcus mitis TaxID=28037 RepID=UPI001292BF94|nr:hypothetical protein [Streptococcus mitis]